MHFIAIHAASWLQGAAIYGTLSYAARTMPMPTNIWGRWIVGIVHFGLSNYEKGLAAMGTTTITPAAAPEEPKQ